MVYDEKKRVITAAAGMVLSNGNAYSSPGGSVYLGVNSSPDSWYEIPEEYNGIIEAEEKEGT